MGPCERGGRPRPWSSPRAYGNAWLPMMSLMSAGGCDSGCLHRFDATDNVARRRGVRVGGDGEVGHEMDDVAAGEVLAVLVVLGGAAHAILEDVAHVVAHVDLGHPGRGRGRPCAAEAGDDLVRQPVRRHRLWPLLLAPGPWTDLWVDVLPATMVPSRRTSLPVI